MPITPPYGVAATITGAHQITISGLCGDNYGGGVWLYYSTDGSSYTLFRHITGFYVTGDPFSYDDQPVPENTRYYYYATGMDVIGGTESAASNVDSRAIWTEEITLYVTAAPTNSESNAIGETFTVGVTATPTVSTAVTYVESFSVTATASVTPDSSQSIKTNYAHYLGDITGKVYEFSREYLSFNGASINSYWTSKVTDFSELDLSLFGKWKTVYWTKIKYVDKAASTPLILSISVDNGAWVPLTQQYIGVGDNGFKDAYFHTVKTGKYFQFKVEWPSADKTFQFTGIEVALKALGEEFKTT
jgi:hypothetical protein